MSTDTADATAVGAPERMDDADDFVTALLMASRVLVGVSARSLAEVEDTVTLAQFRTLVVLDGAAPVGLQRLAELLDVTSSTALRMIDRLLAVSLVTRRENPDDRRQVLLGLTRGGRALVRQVTVRRRREISTIVADIRPERRAALIEALCEFAEAAREQRPDLPSLGVDAW